MEKYAEVCRLEAETYAVVSGQGHNRGCILLQLWIFCVQELWLRRVGKFCFGQAGKNFPRSEKTTLGR
jgi:hypothetical protein